MTRGVTRTRWGSAQAGIAQRAMALLVAAAATLSCATMGLRAAVSLKVEKTASSPRDALVFIDGEYIAQLGTVVERGVRLPEGSHRISVEKNGYFPYDTVILSDRKPIFLSIDLLELPD